MEQQKKTRLSKVTFRKSDEHRIWHIFVNGIQLDEYMVENPDGTYTMPGILSHYATKMQAARAWLLIY